MVRDLPTGVVTLMFTDVEGSTRLLHELGDEYGEALQEHRRRLRAAFSARGGVEVDTQGDAFFVAFAGASSAVAAAADCQRALAGGPIRVRMGLHTGEPRLTEEGYVGLDVHKGARIAAVGHGGQVLLSQTTRALVDADVRDLGVHRLKDISAPERIYQLEVDGLPCDFPLLKTIEAGMKNLPAPRTSFVGRASELDAIDRLLEDPECRLLTLVGPGGAGKTRLALEAAGRRIERYPHGVHFVPLVALASAEFLAPAVAEAMQFTMDGAHSGFSAQEQLLDYLGRAVDAARARQLRAPRRRRRPARGDHRARAERRAADDVARAPQRAERVGARRPRPRPRGERERRVRLRCASSSSARGRSSRASRSTSDQRDQVGRICGLVEGLPLGVELAASWVSMLSCAEIADEIEQNIDFLATSMRDVPERHRSLRAAFDQSWRLLSGEQQHVLARLSVLRGDFGREAAAAVAGADLRLLSELVSKSLVRRSDFGRYELHELLRQYAAEKLAAESPDAVSATRERHARHYLGALAERRSALMGSGVAQARDELRRELDNLRVAAEWAVAAWADDEARVALAGLNEFFFAHSWFDGAETFGRLVSVADASNGRGPDSGSPVALAAVTYRAYLGSALGYDEELDRLARECLPRLRELDMTWELGWCLLALGTNACYQDVYPEAAGYLEEASPRSRLPPATGWTRWRRSCGSASCSC